MLSEAHMVAFAKDLQAQALVFDKHLSLKEAIDKVKSLIADGRVTEENLERGVRQLGMTQIEIESSPLPIRQ